MRLKWAYFRQLWSYVELGIIGCSWAGVSIYVWRHREMTRLGDLFRETKGYAYAYINLQMVSYVNDTLSFVLGFVCFFGSIKLLKFCRYGRESSTFAVTLRYARRDLLYFTASFSIMFFAFLVLFHLLFASNIWACANLLHTTQMLFEMILMKFDTTELMAADAFLGPLVFTMFIVFVVFVGMTMFISIISDSFRTVRKTIQLRAEGDQEMFAFMWYKFQRWSGERSSFVPSSLTW